MHAIWPFGTHWLGCQQVTKMFTDIPLAFAAAATAVVTLSGRKCFQGRCMPASRVRLPGITVSPGVCCRCSVSVLAWLHDPDLCECECTPCSLHGSGSLVIVCWVGTVALAHQSHLCPV